MKAVKEFKDEHLIFVRGDYYGCGRSLSLIDANTRSLVDDQIVTQLAWRKTKSENPMFTGEVEVKRIEGAIMWRPTI